MKLVLKRALLAVGFLTMMMGVIPLQAAAEPGIMPMVFSL